MWLSQCYEPLPHEVNSSVLHVYVCVYVCACVYMCMCVCVLKEEEHTKQFILKVWFYTLSSPNCPIYYVYSECLIKSVQGDWLIMSWRRICRTQEVSCWSCVLTYTLLSFNISRLWQRNIFMFTSGAYLMTSHQKNEATLAFMTFNKILFHCHPPSTCMHTQEIFKHIFLFFIYGSHKR